MARNVVDGTALRSIRELAGFSQRALAKEIGISKSALSQIEAGGGMKPENVKRAAEILRVPITALLATADDQVPVAS